jgi:nucleoside 2-deoxyribosyltransferase
MKLYLAGPDVFLPDAKEIGEVKRQLCARYGHEGLFPLDNEVPPQVQSSPAKTVFRGNIAMLESADALVANLTPFRSASADVGTAFEIGYGFARGKKIFGYANVTASYADRVRSLVSGDLSRARDGRLFAADGLAVEDFGLIENLMMVEAILESGADVVLPSTPPQDPWRDLSTFEECLRRLEPGTRSSSRNDAVSTAAR